MDFYSNDLIAKAESQHRVAELQRDARRSVAPAEGDSSDRNQWSSEFAEWVVSRARVGASFTDRWPALT